MLELKKTPKIDVHMHTTRYEEKYYAIAKEYNVRFVTINTDADVFPLMETQEVVAQEYMKKTQRAFLLHCGLFDGRMDESRLVSSGNKKNHKIS